MSAAVSHEIEPASCGNKTYLAGAGLLMQRNRLEEALASLRCVLTI